MNTLLEDVRFIILVHSRKLLLATLKKRFYVFNKRDDNLLQYQHVTYSMPTILRIVSNIQYTTIYFSRVTAAVHWKLQGSTSKVLTFLIHFKFFGDFFTSRAWSIPKAQGFYAKHSLMPTCQTEKILSM